jgi:hypothetical protein
VAIGQIGMIRDKQQHFVSVNRDTGHTRQPFEFPQETVQGLICGVAFLVNISLKATGLFRLERGKGADIPKPLSLRLHYVV